MSISFASNSLKINEYLAHSELCSILDGLTLNPSRYQIVKFSLGHENHLSTPSKCVSF